MLADGQRITLEAHVEGQCIMTFLRTLILASVVVLAHAMLNPALAIIKSVGANRGPRAAEYA
jgi:hypothetical protein